MLPFKHIGLDQVCFRSRCRSTDAYCKLVNNDVFLKPVLEGCRTNALVPENLFILVFRENPAFLKGIYRVNTEGNLFITRSETFRVCRLRQ